MTASPTSGVSGGLTAERIHAVAARLGAAADEASVLRCLSDVMDATLRPAQSSIVLLDGDSPHSATVIALGSAEASRAGATKFALDELAAGRAITARTPQLWNPSTEAGSDADALRVAGIDLAVSVPLIIEGQSFGALSAGFDYSSLEAEAEDDVVNALSCLAALVGPHLHRLGVQAALIEQREYEARYLEALERLHMIEATLSETSDAAAMLTTIATEFSDAMIGDRAGFIQLGGDTELVVLRGDNGAGPIISTVAAQPGLDDAELKFERLPYSYNPDHRTSANPRHQQLLEEGFQSSIDIPIRSDGKLAGVSTIASRESDGFAERERVLLMAIASFAGVGLSRLQARNKLERDSSRDTLTDLPVRQAVENHWDEVSGNGASAPPRALVFIDIDHFSLVNAEFGLDAGDQALTEIASRLRASLGPDDLLARVSADEFAVSLRGGAARFERVAAAFAESISAMPFSIEGTDYRLTASVGLHVPNVPRSARDAIDAAAAICNRVKESGGARVESDRTQSRPTPGIGDGSMIGVVRDALQADSFVLYGQPIMSTSDLSVRAIEVLVRLELDGVLVAPGKFIPLAERYGLIDQIDEWVVRNALALWEQRENSADQIFINVSPSSLSSQSFPDRIRELIAGSSVDNSQICLEITETGAMHQFDEAMAFLEGMRSEGISLALDDFGVGLSSLSQLRNIPVDVLKIDGSLVQGLESDEVKSALVESIGTMATSLGLATVAEHIETPRALQAVTALGITNAQGNHLAQSAPLTEVLGIDGVVNDPVGVVGSTS